MSKPVNLPYRVLRRIKNFSGPFADKLRQSDYASSISFPDNLPSDKSLPRVIADSVPKSGTYLLSKLISLLGFNQIPVHFLDNCYWSFVLKGDWDQWSPMKDAGLVEPNPKLVIEPTPRSLSRIKHGQFAPAHLVYRSEIRQKINSQDIKHIFIIRDPRACIVSWVDWLQDLTKLVNIPPYYYYLRQLKTDEEKILVAINGLDRFLTPFSYHIQPALKWIHEDGVILVRYEQLVGPLGGGDETIQLATIRRIAEQLGVSRSQEFYKDVQGKLWGASPTFRARTSSDHWQARFTPNIEQQFWDKYSRYMNELGYS